jgi:hypothetical protein
VKPSDVFFSDATHPDDRCPFNCGFAPLNSKPATSIVAKGVTLRGWLVQQPAAPSPSSQAVSINEKNDGGVHLGYEDVHYDFILDYDFLVATAGGQSAAFKTAVLHGNPIDSQTQTYPIQDTAPGGQLLGIDINSFWLPNRWTTLPVILHTELNAWHQRDSHRCGLFGLFCGLYQNYKGRGPAPANWIEKEYTSPVPNTASDNWWPYDPDNPDHKSDSNGKGVNLRVGDYVELQGALWQDTGHDSSQPANCWGQIYHNHEGWLEIHPVDSLTRPPSPGPSPDDALNSALAGVKRVVGVSVCSDGNGAPNHGAWSWMVCPEKTYDPAPPSLRVPTKLVPHVLEMIDGRFTVLGEGLSHSATAAGDCVRVAGSLAPGVRWSRFKASYPVWWTQ